MMYRPLKDRHVLKKAKLLIHVTILRPVLLYCAEIGEGSKQKRVRNADIYDKFTIKPSLRSIKMVWSCDETRSENHGNESLRSKSGRQTT